jgi:hypothetical protein
MGLPALAQVPFPSNYRQYQTADSLDRGPVESPDQVAWRRLLRRPEPAPPRTQPTPVKSLFERPIWFTGVQNALSQEEKLAVGLSMSAFFEYRRETYEWANDRLLWLQEASNAMFTFGDFKTGVLISAFPYLFGDSEVAEAALEAIVVAGTRTVIVKHITGLERPLTAPPHVGPTLEGFLNNYPSGHSATVWAWATVLGEYYDLQWLTYPVASFMGLTLLSRSNTHDFAEIISGSMLGHQTGLESMRSRGWLEPRTFLSGPLEVQTDMGVDQMADSNPALQPGGSPTYGAGRFLARTRASYALNDDLLLQVRYDTARRVYANLPGNNLDHNEIELRLDGRVSDEVLLGATAYRDRVRFLELGPWGKSGTPPLFSFSTAPQFSNAFLQDVQHVGLDLHAVAMPAEDWNVGGHLFYQGDSFVPDPGLSGDTFGFALSGGTLDGQRDPGFQVHLQGGRSSASNQFDRNFLQGGVEGRVALTHRDQIDLSAWVGTDDYPDRAVSETYTTLTAQYSHRFGEDIWAWVGVSYEDRSAPAAGYSRTQPFFRLNGSF